MKLILIIAIFSTAVLSIESVAFATTGCNQFCTLDYKPVCAINSRTLPRFKTFSNMCQLSVANCVTRGGKIIK